VGGGGKLMLPAPLTRHIACTTRARARM